MASCAGLPGTRRTGRIATALTCPLSVIVVGPATAFEPPNATGQLADTASPCPYGGNDIVRWLALTPWVVQDVSRRLSLIVVGPQWRHALASL